MHLQQILALKITPVNIIYQHGNSFCDNSGSHFSSPDLRKSNWLQLAMTLPFLLEPGFSIQETGRSFLSPSRGFYKGRPPFRERKRKVFPSGGICHHVTEMEEAEVSWPLVPQKVV